MALENPFLLPRKLDGSMPDPTHRRGWADQDDPTRLSRFSMVGERMIVKALAGLSTFADEQYGTDQIPLTEAEELMMEASKGTSDLEAEAGIFGVDQVMGDRMDTLKQGLSPHRAPEMAPLEEELSRG